MGLFNTVAIRAQHSAFSRATSKTVSAVRKTVSTISKTVSESMHIIIKVMFLKTSVDKMQVYCLLLYLP